MKTSIMSAARKSSQPPRRIKTETERKRTVLEFLKRYSRFTLSLKELLKMKENGMTDAEVNQAIKDISRYGFIVKHKFPKTFEEETKALLSDAAKAIAPYEKGVSLYQSANAVSNAIQADWNSFNINDAFSGIPDSVVQQFINEERGHSYEPTRHCEGIEIDESKPIDPPDVNEVDKLYAQYSEECKDL
jgi:hypothetical protein